MSFVFDKEVPSCFSSRVSKVRRSNVIENVKLQRELASLDIERSFRHYQMHQEKKDLEKQLKKLKKIKDLPLVGLERRKMSPKDEHSIDFSSTSQFKNVTKARSYSAPPSSSSLLSLPALTCRCAITGYKVRARKLSRESSSASLPITKEEFEGNNFGFNDLEGELKADDTGDMLLTERTKMPRRRLSIDLKHL